MNRWRRRRRRNRWAESRVIDWESYSREVKFSPSADIVAVLLEKYRDMMPRLFEAEDTFFARMGRKG